MATKIVQCPSCGTENIGLENFCRNCGTTLGDPFQVNQNPQNQQIQQPLIKIPDSKFPERIKKCWWELWQSLSEF